MLGRSAVVNRRKFVERQENMKDNPCGTDQSQLALTEAHRLMERLDPEPSHALQVCRLALQIFDQLIPLHGLGEEERLILECAALLHDIGWNTKPSAHHKGSRDTILSEPFCGLDDHQRLLVALVARYHRKSHPHPKHNGYGDLPPDKRRLVRILASFLRIADGLDRSHTDNVKEIVCEAYGGDELHMRLATRVDPRTELYGLRKKISLFEEEFGLEVSTELVTGSFKFGD